MTKKENLVIIPAYNEENNIDKVILDLKKENLSIDILVVNDGSRDRTREVALSSGATVLDLPINLGIGGARQAGLLYALEENYQSCVQMDADGQHPVENIKKLIVNLDEREIVIGSRFIGNKYRGATSRRLGILLLSWVLRLITREKITDPTSGLRAFRRPAISFLAHHYPVDYPEVEPLIFLHWAGFKIREIPVMMKERQGGKSSIAPLYYMIKVILAVFINLFREKPKFEEK